MATGRVTSQPSVSRRVSRVVAYLLPRILLSFGIVALLVIKPWETRTAGSLMHEHLTAATTVGTSLATAQDQISSLPDPATLVSKSRNTTRAYITSVRETQAGFSTQVPKSLDPLPNPRTDERISGFNKVVGDHEYWSAVSEAEVALTKASELLDYHATVMRALTNLYSYDPAVDFSLPPAERSERLSQALFGLEVTLKRIDEAPPYPDKERPVLRSSIDEALKVARQMGPTPSSQEQQTFIMTIDRTQEAIRNNRSLFWREEQPARLKQLETVASRLSPFIRELRAAVH